jgi:PAS domain S-box-containing protein
MPFPAKATANLESKVPFQVPLDELSKYVWSRTAEGTMEYVSPACCDYLGLSIEEVQDFDGLIHPEDIPVRESAMRRAEATSEPQQFQARYRSAAGEYQWFTTFLHSQRDSSNNVIRYFGLLWNIDEQKRERWVSINWDIEERKRAEQQIRDQLTQLNLLGERFPGFLWKALPDGRVTYINRYCEEYLGLTAEEAAAGWGDSDKRRPVARSCPSPDGQGRAISLVSIKDYRHKRRVRQRHRIAWPHDGCR